MPKFTFHKLLLCGLLALFAPLTGCGAVALFPAIAAVVADATAVLSIIERAVDSWFAHKPNPELHAKLNTALSETWSALRVATAATQGAENLTQEEYDAAFADFQTAYQTLHDMLKRNGILKGSRLSMSPEGLEGAEIPDPVALSYQVK
jgi:hypothetical protein